VAEISGLARRIAESSYNALIRQDQKIEVKVEGPPIFLDSKSATAFALVINELVSNALEHGLLTQSIGQVEITLSQDDAWILARVCNSGVGLKPGFDLSRDAGLGLQIVRTLVEKDLHGSLELRQEGETIAEFRFRMNGGLL
jgi:two-component sensor histidine kinase